MKNHLALSVFGIAILLAGCAAPSKITLNRVGPTPVADPNTREGYLVVYSAISTLMNLHDPDTVLHTDYTILSSDGTRYSVKNWAASVLREPVTLSLPPGNYTVEAEAADYGPVQVPVLIENGRTTRVFLDGDSRGKSKDLTTANLVRLPNGSIVGPRAD